jgi:hypothetical protein
VHGRSWLGARIGHRPSSCVSGICVGGLCRLVFARVYQRRIRQSAVVSGLCFVARSTGVFCARNANNESQSERDERMHHDASEKERPIARVCSKDGEPVCHPVYREVVLLASGTIYRNERSKIV